MEFFSTTLKNNKYERTRPRISMKRCKLLQNIENFNGFAMDCNDQQYTLLSSDQPDLQQLWIKSISSKLSKLEKRPNRNKSQPDIHQLKQSRSTTATTIKTPAPVKPVFEKPPIDHSNDPFYPLIEKMLDSFPELTKGKVVHASNTYKKPDNVKTDFKDNAFVEYKKVAPPVLEKPKPQIVERKAPAPATNANILEKLDEYFQFK